MIFLFPLKDYNEDNYYISIILSCLCESPSIRNSILTVYRVVVLRLEQASNSPKLIHKTQTCGIAIIYPLFIIITFYLLKTDYFLMQYVMIIISPPSVLPSLSHLPSYSFSVLQ